MSKPLADKCVYTIRHSSELHAAYKRGGDGSFIERKRWVTAVSLLEKAQIEGFNFPIVFAPGEFIDGLHFWAHIESLSITSDDFTEVHYSGLTPIPEKPPLSSLRLVSSGEPLRNDFLRPYALCYTPEFLHPEEDIDYAPDPEIKEIYAHEGAAVTRTHIFRERSRAIIDAKRRSIVNSGLRLVCEACGFDFEITYGKIGQDFCEVHHLRPLSDRNSSSATTLEDLAIVCSNCHRMIHRGRPFLTLDALREIIQKAKQD